MIKAWNSNVPPMPLWKEILSCVNGYTELCYHPLDLCWKSRIKCPVSFICVLGCHREKPYCVPPPCILNALNLPYVVVATFIRAARCSLLRQGLTVPLGLAWNLLSKPGWSGISWVLGLKMCSTMPYLSKLGFLYVWIFFFWHICTCLVPLGARKGCQIPGNWPYRWVWVIFSTFISISVETGNQT